MNMAARLGLRWKQPRWMPVAALHLQQGWFNKGLSKGMNMAVRLAWRWKVSPVRKAVLLLWQTFKNRLQQFVEQVAWNVKKLFGSAIEQITKIRWKRNGDKAPPGNLNHKFDKEAMDGDKKRGFFALSFHRRNHELVVGCGITHWIQQIPWSLQLLKFAKQLAHFKRQWTVDLLLMKS
jgi:hypothetical protein